MVNYVYPNRQRLPHMHCLKETTEGAKFFTISPSHAMSLAAMAYVHELMTTIFYINYTKFPLNSMT